MARAKYYYNAKTLRYERAGISIQNVISTVVGLLCFGALFFLGLFYLQNKLIDTPAERKLRDENKSLKQHQASLTARLETSKSGLNELLQQEKGLYDKFFDETPDNHTTAARNKELLFADRETFDNTVGTLIKKYKSAELKALVTNDHFQKYASVTRKDLPMVMSFPGAVPVPNPDPGLLVSGFGTRINPWHKAKYHHDGLDFAGVRGSDILATGNGTVILVKNSDLPAGFGSYIEIDHGYGYVTRYTHLGEIKVRMGQKVKKGSVIAHMGMSGGSIAPHVHYEVLKDGNQIDPMKVLVEGMGSYQYSLMAKAASQPNQSLD